MAVAWTQGIAKRSRADVLRIRARATWAGWRERKQYADIAAFCAFLGYARSGHTLLAALLDAHPDAVIANELDAFAVIKAGFPRVALFHMIRENARAFGEGGAEWTGYSYEVPGGWQGRVRTMRVVGDKKAALSTRRLHNNRWLLERTRRVTGVPLRLIHVVRDPFDHVGARIRHKKGDWSPERVMTQLFELYDAVEELQTRARPGEILHLRHEDLIADPRREIERCREFLGLAPEPAWLDAAAGLVLPKPRGGRERIEWTDERRAAIEERIARHEFLSDYAG
jgi:hypothetical protein